MTYEFGTLDSTDRLCHVYICMYVYMIHVRGRDNDDKLLEEWCGLTPWKRASLLESTSQEMGRKQKLI
jgi:hypothetical protein